MSSRTAACLTVVCCAALLFGADWPQWRGPLGTGHATQALDPPLEWSASKNLRWKTPLPGPGNSTPIIVGDRVLVTCAAEQGKLRLLICLDRASGQELWRCEARLDEAELTHETNPACASSPVSDGRRVFVWHGSAGLFAYDLGGNELWRKDLGKFEHIWGYGSSPVVVGERLILSAGPGLRAFVVALDVNSGDELWRFEPRESIAAKADEFRGSWSTPVVARIDGREQLLAALPNWLYALDPATGQVIWKCGGLGDLVYASPLIGDGLVVAMSGYHGPSLAVRTEGAAGDVTATHRLWLREGKPDNPQRVGSGVLVGDHVYIYNEPGVMWCLEARTGQRLWEERLGGTSWCSACLVDGHLFVNNEAGDTFVLEPSPERCRVVARNPLDELMRASLAFAPGQILARGYEHLFCLEAEGNGSVD